MIDYSFFKSGLGGAGSMALQISSFYWLKTTTSYQYKHGLDAKTAFKHLYQNGKLTRFYSGFVPSLILGCTSKYGDIILYKYFKNKDISLLNQNISSSICSTIWRLNLLPIENLDHMLQVNGNKGYRMLFEKIKNEGYKVLYYGGLPSIANNFLGYVSWYYTFSILERNDELKNNYPKCYSAFEGATCTVISDTITNPFRVLKLYRQTYMSNVSYYRCYREIIDSSNYINFATRGLSTRLVMHSLQSSVFVILWKYFDDLIEY